jgi:catechol-2,3-dioxygenase
MWIESLASAGHAEDALGMQITRIDHVSLDVRDRQSAIAWYEEVLGLRAGSRHRIPDQPIFLGPAGARLGLFQERPPGLRHIALATHVPDQRSLVIRLEELAIPYRSERHRDSDSIYFSDPEGTTLEVAVPRS